MCASPGSWGRPHAHQRPAGSTHVCISQQLGRLAQPGAGAQRRQVAGHDDLNHVVAAGGARLGVGVPACAAQPQALGPQRMERERYGCWVCLPGCRMCLPECRVVLLACLLQAACRQPAPPPPPARPLLHHPASQAPAPPSHGSGSAQASAPRPLTLPPHRPATCWSACAAAPACRGQAIRHQAGTRGCLWGSRGGAEGLRHTRQAPAVASGAAGEGAEGLRHAPRPAPPALTSLCSPRTSAVGAGPPPSTGSATARWCWQRTARPWTGPRSRRA